MKPVVLAALALLFFSTLSLAGQGELDAVRAARREAILNVSLSISTGAVFSAEAEQLRGQAEAARRAGYLKKARALKEEAASREALALKLLAEGERAKLRVDIYSAHIEGLERRLAPSDEPNVKQIST